MLGPVDRFVELAHRCCCDLFGDIQQSEGNGIGAGQLPSLDSRKMPFRILAKREILFNFSLAHLQ